MGVQVWARWGCCVALGWWNMGYGEMGDVVGRFLSVGQRVHRLSLQMTERDGVGTGKKEGEQRSQHSSVGVVATMFLAQTALRKGENICTTSLYNRGVRIREEMLSSKGGVPPRCRSALWGESVATRGGGGSEEAGGDGDRATALVGHCNEYPYHARNSGQ